MIFIKNTFKICFVIIGTIIGAGFASGKEIYSFFCVYGIHGFWGLLLSILIIGFIIFKCFSIIIKNNINTYSEFISCLIGKNKILNYSITNIINVFLLISFIVMCAGFGAYFSQEFNLPVFFGATIVSFLAFITFFKNIDGIIKVNSYLIPFLIVLILLLGIKSYFLSFNFQELSNTTSIIWFVRSVLYASYNSIVLIPIIINFKKYINTKKQIMLVTALTILFLIIMSVIIYIVLCINMPEINNIDIPIIYIASGFGLFFKYLYGLVILIAIFTTAISAGFSFLENSAKTEKQYLYYVIFICVFAIFCSNFGFSSLLNLLYPILGYLGLSQIGLLLIK